MPNRRQFIKNLSLFSTGTVCLSMAALTSAAALSGCTTIDEYLITNPSDLSDHVIIVGGGITGLYAAYQLKKRKIPFRLFEASNRLGGQILSDNVYEFGAFEFLNTDKNFLALVKDLNLKTEKTDSKSWIFKNGTADFITLLSDRISGVLPNQQIKLNHRLIYMGQNPKDFKLTFATEKSDKTYTAKNVLLALPAKNLFNVNGLESEIDDQKIKLIQKKQIRIIFSQQKMLSKFGIVKNKFFVKSGVNCTVKVIKGLIYVTLSGGEKLAHFPNEIEMIHIWLAENVFDVPAGSFSTDPEYVYIWTTSATPEILNSAQRPRRHLISEGCTVPIARIENLLLAVNQQIDQFL